MEDWKSMLLCCEELPRGYWAVRNGDGTIYLGDVFTEEIQLKERKIGDYDEPARIISRRPVRISVVEIHAYGKSLDSLGRGMTAALKLEGDGVEHLNGSSVLKK